MDFSAQLDDLQQRAAQTKQAAQAAVTESREQLRQRIDQARRTSTRRPATPARMRRRPRPAPRARGRR
jgi:hypothetical protein